MCRQVYEAAEVVYSTVSGPGATGLGNVRPTAAGGVPPYAPVMPDDNGLVVDSEAGGRGAYAGPLQRVDLQPLPPMLTTTVGRPPSSYIPVIEARR